MLSHEMISYFEYCFQIQSQLYYWSMNIYKLVMLLVFGKTVANETSAYDIQLWIREEDMTSNLVILYDYHSNDNDIAFHYDM